MAQSAFRGGFAGCAIGDAAEGHNPFGDRVGLFLNMLGHGIEEFVELDEMHSLDVPMGPLHLAVKIDAVREPRIQQRDECAARGQRSEEHTSELQSHLNLVCRLLLEKKKKHI